MVVFWELVGSVPYQTHLEQRLSGYCRDVKRT